MFTVQHLSPHISPAYIIFGHWYIWETEACRLGNDTPRWFVGLRQISASLYILSALLWLPQTFLHILTEHVVLLSAPPEVKLPTRWPPFTATTRNPWNISLVLPRTVTAWAIGLTLMHTTVQIMTEHLTTHIIYRMAGNFGGKIVWRIAENITFGGIYFGGWASFRHNNIHSKMANRTRWEFNRAVS